MGPCIRGQYFQSFAYRTLELKLKRLVIRCNAVGKVLNLIEVRVERIEIEILLLQKTASFSANIRKSKRLVSTNRLLQSHIPFQRVRHLKMLREGCNDRARGRRRHRGRPVEFTGRRGQLGPG